MANVGEAWVKVHPDADEFFLDLTKQIEEWKGKDEEEKLPPVKVKPEIDRDKWEQERDDWQKQADKDHKDGKGPTQKVRIAPDDSEEAKRKFQRDIAQIAKTMNRADKKVRVKIDADTTEARAKIAALSKERVRVGVEYVDVDKADKLAQREAALDEYNRRLNDAQNLILKGKKMPAQDAPKGGDVNMRVRFHTDEDALDTIRESVRDVLRMAEHDNDFKLKIGVDAGDLGNLDKHLGALGEFEKRLASVGESATITVEVNDESTKALENLFYDNGFDWKDKKGRWQQKVLLKPKVEADENLFNEAFEANEFLWDEQDGWSQDVKLRVKPDFQLDGKQLARDLDEAVKAITGEQLRTKATLDVDVDAAAAEARLAELTRDRRVKVNVDVSGTELTDKINNLSKKQTVKVNIDPDVFKELDDLIDKFDQAHDVMERVETAWGGNPIRAEVYAEVDDYAAEERLDYLTRDRTVHIRALVHEGDPTGAFKTVKRDVRDYGGYEQPATSRDVKKAADSVNASIFEVAERRVVESPSLADAVTKKDVKQAGENVASRTEKAIFRVVERQAIKQRNSQPEAISQSQLLGDVIKSRLNLLPQVDDQWVNTQLNVKKMEIEEAVAAQSRLEQMGGMKPKEFRQWREALQKQFNRWTEIEPIVARLRGGVEGLGYWGPGRGTYPAPQGAEIPELRGNWDVVPQAHPFDKKAALRDHWLRRRAEGDEFQLHRRPIDKIIYDAIHKKSIRVDYGPEIKAEEPEWATAMLDWARQNEKREKDAKKHRGLSFIDFSDESKAARKYLLGKRTGAGEADGFGRRIDFDATSKRLHHGADEWIKGVKAATARQGENIFTRMLTSGIRNALLAPAHMVKLGAPSVGRIGGGGSRVSMPGFPNIPDATSITKLGQGVGGAAEKFVPNQQAMKLAGKAPGMLKGAGVAAQALVMFEKMRIIAGSLGFAIGAVTDSIAGLGAMVVSVSKPIGQAMLGVAAAPAALAQVVTGVGAVVMSVKGLGTALSSMGDPEEFAQALEELAPSAQEFAKSVQRMYEPFNDLRDVMQQEMFDGMGESFTRMTDNLFPVVEKKFPEMARAIGDLGDTVMDTLGSDRVKERVASTFDGMNESFEAMKPGMAAFTEGMVRMVDVGAKRALPALGRAFSDLGNWFNQYMSEARISSWIDTAASGLRELGGLGKDLWQGSGDFLKAMAAGADASFGEGGVWGAMRGAIADFRDFAASDVGQAKIATFFQGATDSAREVWDIMKQWGGAIVDDVIPAARDFLGKHGDTIGNLGEDLLQLSGKAVSSLGPLVEMIAGVVDGINEITGGPGSQKERKALGKDWMEASDKLDDNWFTGKDDKRFNSGGVRGDKFNEKFFNKKRQEVEDTVGWARGKLDDNMGSVDTGEWRQMADVMARANMQLQILDDGFKGARQSADATASVMSMLGDKITAMPDNKTIEFEADPGDKAITALKTVTDKVEEIEGQPGRFRVEFENEMEVAGAIQKLQADMEGMDAAEISVRGLDNALDHAVQLKAQMDGMGDADVAINVESGQVDEVIAKLREMGIEAQNINGTVYLDTNAPEVQALLEDMQANKDANGQFIIDSNVEEELAELLGLEGMEITSIHHVESNADEVAAESDQLAEPIEQQVNRVPGDDTSAEEPPAPVEQEVNKVPGIDMADTEQPEPVQQEVDRVPGTDESATEPPEPVEQEVNRVAGVDETQMDVPEPVDVPVNFVVGDNSAQAEKEALSSPTESQHTVTADVSQAQAGKESLKTPTESQHTVQDNVQEVMAKVMGLNSANTNSMHTVNSNVSSVLAQIMSMNGRNTTSTHTIRTVKTGEAANGGIFTPMADGGVLARQAKIAPAGSYIMWAENETGGETYIPHALSKRKRSTRILAETANMFGMSVVDADGNPVDAGTGTVTPMANGGVRYANPRSRELAELNRQRARAEALQRVEEQKLERERELKRKKELTPEEKAESQRIGREIEEVKARRKKEEDGYARAMTAYERGKFVYTDVPTDHPEAIKSVDREGLIPRNVRISSTIEDWDEVDERSIGIIRALDNNTYANHYEPKVRGQLDSTERWAVQQGFDPAQVNAARRAVDTAMPLTDLPPEVQRALLTGEEVDRHENWHRDIDQEKLFKGKGSFDEVDWELTGKYLQGWYGDNLADFIGLNPRIARDVPLYNLFNPDDDTWNAALADMRGGKRHVERQYKDQYQEERKVMRDAETAERDRQKEAAKQQKELQKPDQARKQLERELAKERDTQAQRAAGAQAVREHRAAMSQSQQGQGVVVNQTIGNITANDAGEAATKFRRKTMVGFENLTGVI